MVEGKERNRTYRQRLKTRALMLIGVQCVFCKQPSEHAAHVKPTGLKGPSRGLDRRYRDVLKNPDCYRPMCKGCHRVFDGLVSLARVTTLKTEEPIPF
jgi:hypothetical protein